MNQDTGVVSSWPAGRRCAVSFCFDDGKASQLHWAVPALNRLGLRASFYLTTGRLEAARPNARLDIARRWREVASQGHEIGNHTHTHPCSANFAWTEGFATPVLEDMALSDIEAEIERSQLFLEREIGCRASTFAYPCGMAFVGRGLARRSYVPVVAERFLVGRGFNAESAASPDRCDLAHVPALSMDEKTAEQLEELVAAALEEGRWLVLVGHSIAQRPAAYTTEIAAFESILDRVASLDDSVWVDTVENVGRFLAGRREARR